MSPAITNLPILILYPHNRCDCRCVMCDIWKNKDAQEIGLADLERHTADIVSLGVRWVIFSGGEPLMHSDLFALCRHLRRSGIRLTVLSTGITIEKNAASLVEHVDELIVSLDGPGIVHDRIRRVPGAFQKLSDGVSSIHRLGPDFPVAARCTVQKQNFTHLAATVDTARAMGLQSISFLAADVTSTAFNRPEPWPMSRQSEVSLSNEDVERLDELIDALTVSHDGDFQTGFIRESPEKLRRIVLHFRAQLGQIEPVAPRCNAPWVSAVVESDGTVRPCFFHEPIGDIREQSLREALNSPRALEFRRSLNVAENPICRRCVCSLYLQEGA
jgi:MoaA/NifB/PqqE/SkfB family radical SAM enzyme